MMSAMSARRLVVSDDRVAHYVSEKISGKIIPPFTTIGFERDGKIIAGVVFNNKAERDIEVTVAGERGAFTHGFLRAVGHYVFTQLDCLRISITTRQRHVGEIAMRLGAQPEGVKRNYYGENDHAMLFGILRDDWMAK